MKNLPGACASTSIAGLIEMADQALLRGDDVQTEAMIARIYAALDQVIASSDRSVGTNSASWPQAAASFRGPETPQR